MKAVFVHDHKFRRVGDDIYSPGGLSNEVLQRYVSLFEQISVIARITDEREVAPTYSKIDQEHITIKTSECLEEEIRSSDAVLVRLPSKNGLKAVMLARRHKKPFLVEVVGCAFDSYWNHSLTGKFVAVPVCVLNKLAVSIAPYAVYVTKAFLQLRYPSRGKEIAVSDVDILPADKAILTSRIMRVKNAPKKLLLGTVGAVDVAYKGQEYVIRAIRELEQRAGVEIEYHIAGSGNKTHLETVAAKCGVKDKVIFEGVIRHEAIFDWLDGLDIYIHPSTVEGLSRALLEAMSRGLPCVAINVGGNVELLDNDFLVSKWPQGKISQSITQKICELLKNGNMHKQAERNFRKANTEYNREKLDAERIAFYSEFRDCTKRQRGVSL